jgi:hypothetical protein
VRRLLQRQNSRAWLAGPIEGDDGALQEFRLTLLQRTQKRQTSHFRHERFTAQQDHTWSGLPGVTKNLGEIEIVSENEVSVLSEICAYLFVGRRRVANLGPMSCLVTGIGQRSNPPMREVHVDQQTH